MSPAPNSLHVPVSPVRVFVVHPVHAFQIGVNLTPELDLDPNNTSHWHDVIERQSADVLNAAAGGRVGEVQGRSVVCQHLQRVDDELNLALKRDLTRRLVATQKHLDRAVEGGRGVAVVEVGSDVKVVVQWVPGARQTNRSLARLFIIVCVVC